MMGNNTLLQATLPLPPGINASYKTVTKYIGGIPRSALAKTNAAIEFEWLAFANLKTCMVDKDVIELVRNAKGKQAIGLAVELRYYFVTLWKRDIDGGDKAALDVIFAFLGINDNRVIDLHVIKCADKVKPRLEVEVRIA